MTVAVRLQESSHEVTVLALDYEGTIARDGALDPEVPRAITDVREHGITVAIVTGRILDAARHFSFGNYLTFAYFPVLSLSSPLRKYSSSVPVGEGDLLQMTFGVKILKTEDLLTATGPVFDVFSYHLYAAASQRSASMGAASQTTAEDCAFGSVTFARRLHR